MPTIATPHEGLDDTTTYAAFYIENLRTGAGRQVGIVDGTAARQMVAKSTAPDRLAFFPA